MLISSIDCSIRINHEPYALLNGDIQRYEIYAVTIRYLRYPYSDSINFKTAVYLAVH